MRVLLMSMPQTVGFLDAAIHLPHLGISSLAGNLPNSEVKTLDLLCLRRKIRRPVLELVADFQPQVVGLSAMTFQFETLARLAALIREADPSIRIVAGGCHITAMIDELATGGGALPLDFVVRGEGEVTFAELIRELGRKDPDPHGVLGLSWRNGDSWVHNPPRPPAELETIEPPDRSSRLGSGFYYLGDRADVAEASRGCPFDCTFCSITNMYGSSFRIFPVDRVIADLERARSMGAEHIFFTDDNLSYAPDHFRELCEAIHGEGLDDMSYSVQATAVGLANNPELVASMERANFEFCFVGFESMSPATLRSLHKPTNPEINRTAASLLHRHGIAIIAGCIMGYPDDAEEDIVESFRQIRSLRPDVIYAQYLTPYPKTPLRDEMLAAGLVDNADDFSAYDGFNCNVRTKHLSHARLYRVFQREFLKTYFDPGLVLRNRFLLRHPLSFLKASLRGLSDDLQKWMLSRSTGQAYDV